MIRSLAAFAAVTALPALALAAEAAEGVAAHGDAGHAPATPVDLRWAPFVGALLMFGIVFFVLNKKVWPVILKALKAREEKIRTEIDDAERARKQAQAALAQYEKALSEARNEAAKMLEQARIDQMKMSAELRAKAEHEIISLKESAQRDIEASKRAAIGEIYGQMADAAAQAAGRIMRRELTPADHKRLIEESLREFEEVSARN